MLANLATELVSEAPWPPAPMTPTLTRSFGPGCRSGAAERLSATKKPAPARAPTLRKSRRVVGELIVPSLGKGMEGGALIAVIPAAARECKRLPAAQRMDGRCRIEYSQGALEVRA